MWTLVVTSFFFNNCDGYGQLVDSRTPSRQITVDLLPITELPLPTAFRITPPIDYPPLALVSTSTYRQTHSIYPRLPSSHALLHLPKNTPNGAGVWEASLSDASAGVLQAWKMFNSLTGTLNYKKWIEVQVKAFSLVSCLLVLQTILTFREENEEDV